MIQEEGDWRGWETVHTTKHWDSRDWNKTVETGIRQ